jgi:hypothetical protein
MTELDPRDPYDAASVWCCFIICDTCGELLDFPMDDELGLDYYHRQGQRAKSDGWHVEARSGDVPDFLMLCPRCAAESGAQAQPPDHRTEPHPSVLTICQLSARVGKLPE